MNLTRLSMVAAAGLLAACSTAPTVEPPAASQPPASSPAAAPTQDAPTAAGEPTQGEGTQPFGSTATWPDGVSITVSKPMPFKPSEYAAVGTKAPKYAPEDDLAVVGGGVRADDPHELSDTGRHRAAFFCGGFLQPE